MAPPPTTVAKSPPVLFKLGTRLAGALYSFREAKIDEDAFLCSALAELYHMNTLRPEPKDIRSTLELRPYNMHGRIHGAALAICLWYPAYQDDNSELPPPLALPEQTDAEKLFRAINQPSLEVLEAIDETITATSKISLLQNSGFRQLFVVLALLIRNKILATALIAKYPPGPDHDLLFSHQRAITSFDEARYRPIIRHPLFVNAAFEDNGCDIWISLLRHGWASPQPHMLSWALTTTYTAGEALLRELAPLMYSHPLFTPDEVFSILRNGIESARAEPDLVNLYVSLCSPKDHGTAKHIRSITHGAACYRGAEYLKLLLRHGAHDFFGMDPKQHTPKYRGIMRDQPYDDYFGYTEMSTALHFAVSEGNVEAVEFLLAQPGGEVQWRDGYGRTAYDYGKHREMLMVEGRNQRPIPGLDRVFEVLEQHGWKASTPEEIKAAECEKPDPED